MNIHTQLKRIDLSAGGQGSGVYEHEKHGIAKVAKSYQPYSEYNKEKHEQIHQHLTGLGFKKSGDNRDPSKGHMVSYVKTVHNPEHGISTTHGVHVEPNGSWMHTMTDAVKGDDVSRLKLALEKSEALSASRAKRKAIRI